MSTITERPTTAERYIRATNSRNLSVDPDARTDADLLLAAGYVSAGNARGSLALRFYRLRATGDMTPFRELAEIAGEWMRQRSSRGGRRDLNRIQAVDLATRAMFWWLNPACKVCDGLGHPKMPNSPTINHAHNCPTCRGTGQYPIHRVVPPGMADEAHWLVDSLDSHCAMVFSDMRKRMPSLEL